MFIKFLIYLKLIFIILLLFIIFPVKLVIILTTLLMLYYLLFYKKIVFYKLDRLDKNRGRIFIFNQKKASVYGDKGLYNQAKNSFKRYVAQKKIEYFSVIFFDWLVDILVFFMLYTFISIYQLNREAEYSIIPKDCVVNENSSVKFSIKGNYSQCKLYIGNQFVSMSNDSLNYVLENIKNSLTYVVVMNYPKGKIEKKYKIIVNKYPRLVKDSLFINYPSYSKIPLLKMGWKNSKISVLYGSLLDIKLKIKYCDSAKLIIGNKSYLIYNNKLFSNRVKLHKNLRLKLMAKNGENLQFIDSLGPQIKIIYDKKPFATLLYPDSVSKVPQDENFVCRVYAIDDFGLNKIVLKYRVKSKFSSNEIKLKNSVYNINNKIKSGQFTIEKSLKGRFPGDSIFYSILVYDYRGKFGSKYSKLGPYLVYYPSFTDLYKKFDKSVINQENFINKQSTRELEKELYKLKNGVDKKSFKKQFNDIALKEKNRLKDINKRKSELSKDIKDIQKNLKSDELSKKLKTIDSLLNDKNIKRLQKLLSDSLKTNKELINSLKQYKFELQKELKRLDRLIKSLKQLKKMIKKDMMLKKMDSFNNKLKERIADSSKFQNSELKQLKKEFKSIKQELEKSFKKSNLLDSALQNINRAQQQNSNKVNSSITKNELYKATKNIDKFIKQNSQKSGGNSSSINILGVWQVSASITEIWENYIKTDDENYYTVFLNYYPKFKIMINNIVLQNPKLQGYFEQNLSKIDGVLSYYNRQTSDSYHTAKYFSSSLLKELNILTIKLFMLENSNKKNGGSGSGKSGSKPKPSLSQMMQKLDKLSLKQAMLNSLTLSLLKQLNQRSGAGKSQSQNGKYSKKDIERFRELSKEQQEIQKELQKMEGSVDENALLKKRFSQLSKEASNIANKLQNIESRKIAKLQNDFLKNLKETISGFKQKKEFSKKREGISSKKLYYEDSIKLNLYNSSMIYENYLNYILRYSNKIDKKVLENYYNNLLQQKR